MTMMLPARPADRFAVARAVADAVLYEGYVLYPYRASSRKNQIRWTFGVLAPRRWAEADGSERSTNRTEVIVDPGDVPVLRVRIRCLQVQERRIEGDAGDGTFGPVDGLVVGGVTHVDFAEAIEHELDLPPVTLLPLAGARAVVGLHLDAGLDAETIEGPGGDVVGRVVRQRWEVSAQVCITARWAEGPNALLHVTVEVENTVADDDPAATRDEALHRSLAAVHTLLAIDDGAFVSLLEPPDYAAAAARSCRSEATFPVLIGAEGSPTADVVLSSPIILYDHPAVAPESQGDLFDATEIDEILALRILTLTDEEKAEARGTDRRAAAIVDRWDDMPPEVWERLHGAIRSLSPSAPRTRPVAAGGGAVVGSGRRRRRRPVRRHGGRRRARRRPGHAGRAPTVAPRRRPRPVPRRPARHRRRGVPRRRRRRPPRRHPGRRSGHRAAGGAGPLLLLRARRGGAAVRVLVAGIGNVFFGDDGFGVEVADRLAGAPLPDGVRLGEYGIRGVHLAYELLDGYDALVLIDALAHGRGARHGGRAGGRARTTSPRRR